MLDGIDESGCLQQVLFWSLRAFSVSVAPWDQCSVHASLYIGSITAEHILGFVGLSHSGSPLCVTDQGDTGVHSHQWPVRSLWPSSSDLRVSHTILHGFGLSASPQKLLLNMPSKHRVEPLQWKPLHIQKKKKGGASSRETIAHATKTKKGKTSSRKTCVTKCTVYMFRAMTL